MSPEEFQATKRRIAADQAAARQAARAKEWKIAGIIALIGFPLVTAIGMASLNAANAPPPPPTLKELQQDCAFARGQQAVANGPRQRAEVELANIQAALEATGPGSGDQVMYLRQRLDAMQRVSEVGAVETVSPQVCHDYDAQLVASTRATPAE